MVKDRLAGVKIYRLRSPDHVPKTVQRNISNSIYSNGIDYNISDKHRFGKTIGVARKFSDGSYGIWVDTLLKGTDKEFVIEHEREHIRKWIKGEKIPHSEAECNRVAIKRLRERGMKISLERMVDCVLYENLFLIEAAAKYL